MFCRTQTGVPAQFANPVNGGHPLARCAPLDLRFAAEVGRNQRAFSEIADRLRRQNMRELLTIVVLISALLGPRQASAQPQSSQVNTIQELMAHLRSCWKAPLLSEANAMNITVLVSFTRSGQILGHPKVTHESPNVTDHDRLEYRNAAMQALQRCTPVPFTAAMGGAIAGRPIRLILGGETHPFRALRACISFEEPTASFEARCASTGTSSRFKSTVLNHMRHS